MTYKFTTFEKSLNVVAHENKQKPHKLHTVTAKMLLQFHRKALDFAMLDETVE